MAFWEAYIEGKNPWARASVGWKLRLSRKVVITGYHAWLLLFLLFAFSLPLIIYGWDFKLFGVLVSAVSIGVVIEDFLWFVVNPYYGIKEHWNPENAYWYPWLKIGKISIPVIYVLGILICLLSYIFIWR